MTPLQLARTACPNHLPNGECVALQSSIPQDYSAELPKELSPAEWTALVAEARAKGELMVTAYFPTGYQPNKVRPQADRRRLDLYFCLQCGKPMGIAGEVCLECRGKKLLDPELIDTRCLLARSRGTSIVAGPMEFPSVDALAEYVEQHGDEAAYRFPLRRCRFFERHLIPLGALPGPVDDPDLQVRRRKGADAYLRMFGLPGATDGRFCPKCRGPMPKHKHRCPKCATERRREKARERKQRERGGDKGQVSRKPQNKSIDDNGFDKPVERGRPSPGSPRFDEKKRDTDPPRAGQVEKTPEGADDE